METKNKDILIIGAGLAGIEASLLCARAGRKVYLLEKEPYFGGSAIKSEEVFPLMECATCMLAPKQSDVLENKNIELLTLSELQEVQGEAGNFTARIKKQARYVSLENCIGCGACFEPCPVEIDNNFEEGLSKRKAIYIACAGALPNAPAIDMNYCLRKKGEDCQACKQSCMFDAILYDDKDREITVNVGAIIVATGFKLGDASQYTNYGYKKFKNVLSAFEFERLRASNGPTTGIIQTKDGSPPDSIALIHCVGRKEKGYCSQVCCLYLTKFAHYAFDKIPGVKVYQFYKELSIPGKENEHFYKEIQKKGINSIRAENIEIIEADSGLQINYQNGNNKNGSIAVDMVVLAPPIEPHPETRNIARILNIELDQFGFLKTQPFNPVESNRAGIYIAGCAREPNFMQEAVVQAQDAAGQALNITED